MIWVMSGGKEVEQKHVYVCASGNEGRAERSENVRRLMHLSVRSYEQSKRVVGMVELPSRGASSKIAPFIQAFREGGYAS